MEKETDYTQPTGMVKGGLVNPSKPYATIQIDENAPAAHYRGNEHYSPATHADDLHFATPVVVTELLAGSTQLITLLKTCPELANQNLEILQEGNNVYEVKAYVNKNRSAFTANLDASIKRWADKVNFRPSVMFGTSDLGGIIMQILSSMYARYKKRCANPKTTTPEIIEMNKNIKMLLEIKVLGLQKENTVKVD